MSFLIQKTLFLLSTLANASALSCLDPAGAPVPSFVVRNLPRAEQVYEERINGVKQGSKYRPWGFYKIGGSGDFDFKESGVVNALTALQRTQDQWRVEPAGVQYMAWNSGIDTGETLGGSSGAHDKGFVAWNTDDNTGVYLGHSYPEWDVSLGPSEAQMKAGQHAICISLKSLDEVNKVLSMVYTMQPIVKKATFYSTISNTATGPSSKLSFANKICESINTKEWPKKSQTTTVVDISGKKFVFVAKAHGKQPQADKDIYTLAARILNVKLKVSTWAKLKNGGTLLTENVKDLQYSCPGGFDTKYKIPSVDHSKWGYSFEPEDSAVVVLAGANREASQHTRGALLVAIQDAGLHQAVSKMYEGEECMKAEKQQGRDLGNLPSSALADWEKAEAFVGSKSNQKTDLRVGDDIVVISGFDHQDLRIRTNSKDATATWQITESKNGAVVSLPVIKIEPSATPRVAVGVAKPFIPGETRDVRAELYIGGKFTSVFKFQLRGEIKQPKVSEPEPSCKPKPSCDGYGKAPKAAKRPRLKKAKNPYSKPK
jgi:hypothetical protein